MKFTGAETTNVADAAHERTLEPLFRSEVLEANGAQWLGEIRLAQPVAAWVVVAAAGVIAILLLALIIYGDYTRKANIQGIVEPVGGSLTILATNAGVITEIFVTEGQHVKAGEPLFRISSERQDKQGELTALIDQQLSARKNSLDVERRSRMLQASEKRAALAERLRYLDTETAHLEEQIGLAAQRKALAENGLARLASLQKNGFISQTQLQSKEDEILELSARLSELRRNKDQLAANRVSLLAEQKDVEQSLVNDLAQIGISEATLNQEIVENRNRRESFIPAPAGGIVTAVTYRRGQAVVAGQVLAAVVPAKSGPDSPTELHVELFSPSRSIGFVAIGQHVALRYHAFPYEKFGLQEGVISGISKTPFARADLPPNIAGTLAASAASPNEGLYRIDVQLARQNVDVYGTTQPLKVGMTVDADVIQDRRKIWEWMLEPVLAVAHH